MCQPPNGNESNRPASWSGSNQRTFAGRLPAGPSSPRRTGENARRPEEDVRKRLGKRPELRSTRPLRPLHAPGEEALPDRLGRYRRIRTLGAGGMGRVDLAQDLVLGRVVAIKTLLADAGDATARERFLREARALARLRHRHLIAILDVGEEGTRPWFAMEYVEGRTLAEAIEVGLPRKAGLLLVARVARAVDHAHEAGIVHRDLKPTNVLVDERGEPRVVDFGLARAVDSNASTVSRSGALIGTPAYMAPEQARGDLAAVDARTDVWALGVMLFEVLTGRRAYEGTQYDIVSRIVLGEPPSLEGLEPRFDRDLVTIVERATRKEKDLRYPTAAALAEDLERWLAGEPILARPSSRLERLRRWAGRHRERLAFAVVVALLGVAALAATVLGERRTSAAIARDRAGSLLARDRDERERRARQIAVHAADLEDLERRAFEAARRGSDLGAADALAAAWGDLEERSARLDLAIEPALRERVEPHVDLAVGRAIVERSLAPRFGEARARLTRVVDLDPDGPLAGEARWVLAALVAASVPEEFAGWPGATTPAPSDEACHVALEAIVRLHELLGSNGNQDRAFPSDLVRARLFAHLGRGEEATRCLAPWRSRVKDWAARGGADHGRIFDLYEGLVAAAGAGDPPDLDAVAGWMGEARLLLSDPRLEVDPGRIVPVACRASRIEFERWLAGDARAGSLERVRAWLDHARSVSAYTHWPPDLPWMLGVALVEAGQVDPGRAWLAQALEDDDFAPAAEPRYERSAALREAIAGLVRTRPAWQAKWEGRHLGEGRKDR